MSLPLFEYAITIVNLEGIGKYYLTLIQLPLVVALENFNHLAFFVQGH